MKLLGYLTVKGHVQCLTALRIGGSGDVIEIGGLDNPLIKHPLTGMPFVPGSSLKGKMRALLELHYGMIDGSGQVHTLGGKNCGLGNGQDNCPICRVFGVARGGGSPFGPGRLIVRDGRLIGNTHIVPNIDAIKNEADRKEKMGQLKATERKWENTINRITGVANPRQMERVPEGAIFQFAMDYRVFDTKDEQVKSEVGKVKNTIAGETDFDLFKYVLQGLRLIELDALGSSGSRGYGKVSFGTVKVTFLDDRSTEITIADIPLDAEKFRVWDPKTKPADTSLKEPV